MQVLPEHRSFESLIRHRSNTLEAGRQFHVVPFFDELLGQAGGDEVPLGVVDDDALPRQALPSSMICSGVRTYGSDASAPGIEACV